MSSTAFAKSPRFFDLVAVATGRDVDAECAAIRELALAARPGATTLFDAAAGTGQYLERFAATFEARGIERDPIALQIARSRPARLDVDLGSLEALESEARYDVVIALRGAIAEARSVERLEGAVARLAGLCSAGGVLFIEPYAAPESYTVGAIEAVHVDEPRVKISRVIVTKRVAHIAVLDYNYLIATNLGVERHFERIERGLYTSAAYAKAFVMAGLECELVIHPAFPAGLFLGRKRDGGGARS